MQDAPIEEIARAAGIARGLIYRHFSSKEELYVLTVIDYLAELGAALEAATAGEPDPVRRLERLTEAYARYCLRYPAFLDSSHLAHAPPGERAARDRLRVGLAAARAGHGALPGRLAAVLRDGAEAGVFAVEDPDYMANVLWTQALGLMHLARIGVGVRNVAPGIPGLFTVEPERVVRTCVDGALAVVQAG